MRYTKRVIINDCNDIIKTIITENKYYKKLLKDIEIWSIDDFTNKIKDTEETIFLAFGHEFYDHLRWMNDSHIIHIGLRNFDYNDFQELQFLHLGKNRLIYDACLDIYSYEAEEGKKTKKWTFKYDLLDEVINDRREKIDYFMSSEPEMVYLEYPKTKIVGLHEGKDVLSRLDKLIVHRYDTAVNYDWYRNPDNLVWNEIGFDFETFNSKKGSNLGRAFPEFDGTRTAGFALSYCDPYTEKSEAIFFDFRKDYNYDESKWENDPVYKKEYFEFLEVMKQFFDNHYKHIWAYNASFEYHMLYVLLRKFYYIQDAYALCIADDKRASLKLNVQLLLRSPSWDDELDADFAYFEQIAWGFDTFEDFEKYELDYYKYTKYSYEKTKELFDESKKELKEKEREICKENGFKAKADKEKIEKLLWKTKEFKTFEKYESALEFQNELNKKDPIFTEAMNFFSKDNPNKRHLLKTYWRDIWGGTGVMQNNSKYGTKEENCLGLYCGIDAFAGERLARLLAPAYINNCYTEILNHRYIAAELKMCGIKVDKKRLLELYRFCWTVDNNSELAYNLFNLKVMKENVNPYYVDIFNELSDEQKYWLVKYPLCFTGSNIKAGSALISEVYDELSNDNSDYVPIKELYSKLGKQIKQSTIDELLEDYELQPYTIENYNNDSFSLVNPSKKKQKEFLDLIGKELIEKLEVRSIIKKINKFALEIFSESYKDIVKQNLIYWLYDEEVPFRDTKYISGETKEGLPKFTNLFELLEKGSDFKKLSKAFDFVDEKMFKNLQKLPKDLREKFKNLVPLNDKKFIKEYIDKYSWEQWIPNSQLYIDKSLTDIPTYSDFVDYLNLLHLENICSDDIESTEIGFHELLKSKSTGKIKEYPKLLVSNYFSPDDLPVFYNSLNNPRNLYLDYVMAIRSVARCFDSYKELKGLEDTNSKDLWKGMLEYLNNSDYRKSILNNPDYCDDYLYFNSDSEDIKKEYDYFEKEDPKTGLSGIDLYCGPTSEFWEYIYALEDNCSINDVISQVIGLDSNRYDAFKLNGKIPKIVEELIEEYNDPLITLQLNKLWDIIHIGFIRRLSSTCRKILSTYIPAIDMGYKKYFLTKDFHNIGENSIYGTWEFFEQYQIQTVMDNESEFYKGVDFLYSKECDDWWFNEVPDVYCLPPYQVLVADTKRNASAFHTYRHG